MSNFNLCVIFSKRFFEIKYDDDGGVVFVFVCVEKKKKDY